MSPIITVHLHSGTAISLRRDSLITASVGPQIAAVTARRRGGDSSAWIWLEEEDGGFVLIDPAAIERITIGGNPAAVGFVLAQ